MPKDELFLTPVSDVIPKAVKIATEAAAGELGDAAEAAYQDQVEGFLDETGMTMEELDNLGAPTTWFGRLVERVEDWWWDFRDGRGSSGEGDDFEEAEAAFSFPVPLLKTRPLQDTPYEYEEVDVKWAAAATEIAEAITSETDWTPMPFQAPVYDEDLEDDSYDPCEQILAVWRSDAGHIFLIDQHEEDPKIMGQRMGLVHLPKGVAEPFIKHISNRS